MNRSNPVMNIILSVMHEHTEPVISSRELAKAIIPDLEKYKNILGCELDVDSPEFINIVYFNLQLLHDSEVIARTRYVAPEYSNSLGFIVSTPHKTDKNTIAYNDSDLFRLTNKFNFL